MKASVEYALIFLMGCFMMIVLMQFSGVIATIHRGNQYLDYLLHITDNYDGDLLLVAKHNRTQNICRDCEYQHIALDDRYEVEVRFPITLSSLRYKSSVKIYGLTHRFK